MIPETPTDAEIDETSSSWNGEERRAKDRRGVPTRPWSGLVTPSRRSQGRRASDREGYVDRYTKRDVILLLTIFLLNVGDALMTLLWLDRGGREANPIMDFFLEISPWAFLVQKCLVVGLWLVILLIHKNFRLARIGLYSALVVYGTLMIVHFGIVAFGVEPPSTTDPTDPTDATPMNATPIHVAPMDTTPTGATKTSITRPRDARPATG